MLFARLNGATSNILRVKLLDSSSTVGAGLTGLTFSSSSLIISTIADNEASAVAYTQAGSTIETISTLGTFAAPTATKCRFKEVDSTNHKGIYELQFADARFAVSNAKSLLVSLLGATNLAQCDFVVQLQSDDPYVAKPANSNLFAIDGSGRVDLSKISGDTTAVSNFLKAVKTIGRGTVGSSSSTTSVTTSSFTPSMTVTSDQFKGRDIIFDIDTATSALRGQATKISANTNSTTPTFTVDLLNSSPASGDTFGIY